MTDNIEELREILGTLPRATLNSDTPRFVRGGEEISVKMISPNPLPNYYAGMFVMAVATWGGAQDSGIDKWNRCSPEQRRMVVQAVLERKTIPGARELPSFMFEVTGASRSAFDQIARGRVGYTFASMGVRDNSHENAAIVVPPNIFDNNRLFSAFAEGVRVGNEAYREILLNGNKSFQDARALLPMSMMHRFCMNINYQALSSFMGQRLMFEEQYDTVAVAYKMKQELARHYAMLAAPLQGTCDALKRCVYHNSELFSGLFKGCERYGEDDGHYTTFNEASANVKDIEAWLGEPIPAPGTPIDWDTAFDKDRHFFEQRL
jgi:thymidylate synthase ThyX